MGDVQTDTQRPDNGGPPGEEDKDREPTGKSQMHDAMLPQPDSRRQRELGGGGTQTGDRAKPDVDVVHPGGVEPPTYRSVVCRSIQLS